MTVQQHTLANGFRIVSENMPGLESASIGIWVTAGGRHERPEQNGIAHFLEHMAFKGTKTRSALQIAEAIEDVGGYINAYTSREVTAYYARVLKDDVPLAMDVIGDILLNPVFDPREIEVERGVILQEIGQALDTPDDVIFDWLQEESYRDQALGRTILGPAERIRSFSRNDLQGFVDQHYGPGQMILAAAGAVDHDALVRLAEAQFGHMAPRPVPEPDAARFTGGGEARRDKQLEQAHFALALESPGYRDDEIYTAQIYASALGGGMSSRLFQEIREKRGLCYTIFAQAGAYADTGSTTIYAGTSGDQLADLAHITIDEMKRAAEDMREDEVARARAQMKAGMLMGLESPSNRAERLARLVQIWDRVPPLEDTVARIDAVTVAGVRALAERLAVAAPAALALYGPVADAPSLARLQERRAA
ncbi:MULTISPECIES: M16 family metallopeptidase [Phaeobacter]|uniref:Pitrilysin family protein n=2 Tax=Phaeobacter gallaeciensis TaxID=60890 RepID=A0ABD4X7S6_9RHOB|nr:MULTISPECIES: pitrilysin family protein [Phaeobacter]MEE2633733.1 pitrilysin family protein [Pseudomonadota bacterium]MDE4060578.1 pitrilysin family protein [Phaeobacter gallaeciensis]MDE4123618.1 pitrilysin family protein [Phaeobacter gallaeciensis]MDE4128067.1 pitrilysin family protein [Phaeobacter gallaeciensis]MDE4144091.1 pitrilysin family protein [Phaeobacter gallaeciensis]